MGDRRRALDVVVQSIDERVAEHPPHTVGPEPRAARPRAEQPGSSLSPIDEAANRLRAIRAAGATTSRAWAKKFAAAGCVVVDNSSAWWRDEDVPLVVAEVNPHALERHHGLVANPNCSTMQLMVVLKPLLDTAGIERLIVSTYQSVSGTGLKAVGELRAQTRAVLRAPRRRRRASTRTRSRSTSSAAPATSPTATTTRTRSAR